MKRYYKELLDCTFELEGLLLLGLNKEELPVDLQKAIEKKLDTLISLRDSKQLSLDSNCDNVIDNQKRETTDPSPAKSEEAFTFYALEDDEEEKSAKVKMSVPGSVKRKHRRKLPGFSLNDRFLFIRELFEGDAASFNKALNKIASYDSYEDAENYLVSDICPDSENSETQGRFLKIIEDYFKD